MAYDIKSKEFAEAWRIVSETLLSTLQQGSITQGISDIVTKTVDAPPFTEETPNTDSATLPNHGKSETLYAASPIGNGNGGFMFKSLKDEKQDNSIFEVTRFEDGYCEFTLCDLTYEARQILFDQKNSLLPPQVGALEGDIKVDNSFQTLVKGVGERNGRSVRIINPMKVKFS